MKVFEIMSALYLFKKAELDELITRAVEVDSEYAAKIKAEAYKEILNFLKNRLVCKEKLTAIGYESAIIDIDNLLKELVGEDNGG